MQDGWRAELPDYILDTDVGVVQQLKLDLAASADTCISRSACIDFLLRRQTMGGLSSEAARLELALTTLKARLEYTISMVARIQFYCFITPPFTFPQNLYLVIRPLRRRTPDNIRCCCSALPYTNPRHFWS